MLENKVKAEQKFIDFVASHIRYLFNIYYTSHLRYRKRKRIKFLEDQAARILAGDDSLLKPTTQKTVMGLLMQHFSNCLITNILPMLWLIELENMGRF